MKRFLALLLCFALFLSLIPAAFAGDIEIIDAEEAAVVPDEPDAAPLPEADQPLLGGTSGLLEWSLTLDGTLFIEGHAGVTAGTMLSIPKDEVKAVILRESIDFIDQYTFCNMPILESVMVPDSARYIERNAFAGCPNLKNVVIGNGVTRLGTECFLDCTSLEQISIPANVTQIGEKCFKGDVNLKTVYFLGSAPSIANNAFSDVHAFAYYPESISWAGKKKNYGGSLDWASHNGFTVSFCDLTGGDASYSISQAQPTGLYSGAVSCTLTSTSEKAVIAVEERTIGDAKSYRLCTINHDSEPYRFSLFVDQDITLYILYRGDINLDGKLKGTDGTMLKRYLLGSYTLKNVMALLAIDLNNDGNIVASSGTKVARSVLGTYTIPW